MKATNLQDNMTTYGNVSLRKLCLHLGVNYQRVLKAKQKPIEGQVWTKEACNWDAVAKAIGHDNLSTLTLETWESLNAESSTGLTSGSVIKAMEGFEVGQKIYLRREADTPYEVIYLTSTHIVIMLESTEKPTVMNHNTFLFQGPSLQARDPNAARPQRKIKTTSLKEVRNEAVATIEGSQLSKRRKTQALIEIDEASSEGQLNEILDAYLPKANPETEVAPPKKEGEGS